LDYLIIPDVRGIDRRHSGNSSVGLDSRCLHDLRDRVSVHYRRGFLSNTIQAAIRFYAPGDFTKSTPVVAFVEAMQSVSRTNEKALARAVERSINAAIARVELTGGKKIPEYLVGKAIADARTELKKSSIRVHFAAIDPRLTPQDVVIASDTTVQEFLNEVWLWISDYVPAYTYGLTWALFRDSPKEGMQQFRKKGTPDHRTLHSAGLWGGHEVYAHRMVRGKDRDLRLTDT